MRFGQIEALAGIDLFNQAGTNTASLKAHSALAQNLSFFLPTEYPEDNAVLQVSSGGTIFYGPSSSSLGRIVRLDFVDANLTAGIFTFDHNIGELPIIQVVNDAGFVITPDQIDHAGGYLSCTINLSSFGTIAGTWNAVAVG